MGRELAHALPPKFLLVLTDRKLSKSISTYPLTPETPQTYTYLTVLASGSSRTIFQSRPTPVRSFPRLSVLRTALCTHPFIGMMILGSIIYFHIVSILAQNVKIYRGKPSSSPVLLRRDVVDPSRMKRVTFA